MSKEKQNKKERDEMHKRGYIWCNYCKSFLHYSKFGKVKMKGNYGYNFKCKHCSRQYQRENGHIKKARKNTRERYRENKAYFTKLFGGKCTRCGFEDDFWALEFHHVYPTEKLYTPSTVINSNDIERAIIELDKCVLLCSNCHKTFNKTWTSKYKKIEHGYIPIGIANIT